MPGGGLKLQPPGYERVTDYILGIEIQYYLWEMGLGIDYMQYKAGNICYYNTNGYSDN